MKKTYAVKPKTEIELQFEDGKSINVTFDAAAIQHLVADFDGGLSEALESEYTELCARIIYAGSMEHESDMSIEKAKQIVSNLDLETLTSIIEDFTDSLGKEKKAEIKEFQKKSMTEFMVKKST
ncbi:hypothetical protein [Lachnoclostridium sp.]|uniref:hypothetical protein n=1 Tax=Lachnoclostridium sp. TaxID=2028282 RepID=UPI00289C9A9F|nr:hypothetical protein [Lachnoclostridium sp.]